MFFGRDFLGATAAGLGRCAGLAGAGLAGDLTGVDGFDEIEADDLEPDKLALLGLATGFLATDLAGDDDTAALGILRQQRCLLHQIVKK